MGRIGTLMPRRGRRHEVSILIVTGAGVGRCFGSQPRAKVSMMIKRPPQQGHGRGGARGSSVVVASAVSGSFGREGTASNSRARAILAARLPLANSPYCRVRWEPPGSAGGRERVED